MKLILKKLPIFLALLLLNACQQQANFECAEYAFLTAVKLDPNNLTAANNLYFLQHRQD